MSGTVQTALVTMFKRVNIFVIWSLSVQEYGRPFSSFELPAVSVSLKILHGDPVKSGLILRAGGPSDDSLHFFYGNRSIERLYHFSGRFYNLHFPRRASIRSKCSPRIFNFKSVCSFSFITYYFGHLYFLCFP